MQTMKPVGPVAEAAFADRLLSWFDQHGRHDLPWQHPRSPWRVWVSEIMLQQTQVATVIGYFDRFMARFPTPAAMAEASVDDVLALWSGLGYYSRARNLHAAAQRVAAEHGGEVPADFDALVALPGIGASTAAAICAQAFGQRHAILDANVKRVLARHAGVEGWPGRSPVTRQLQTEADARLPDTRLADYTQAIMDLGARLCAPRSPACPECPVAADCVAHREQRTAELPAPKPRRQRPERSAFLLLIARDDGCIWLERRPPAGIWGGLWAPPIVEAADKASLAAMGLKPRQQPRPEPLRHGFTHFVWQLQPMPCAPVDNPVSLREDLGAWHTIGGAQALGLPAPIRRLLESLEEPPS
ncbi:A/G-specific adenine glycosylase [Algiphilus aromaticivorans]|uniref:A/G-specific adenine glycosylase n=1 Tax=Algiphilus aromaticivorans TaxID=382454 RepID=UPI001E3B8AFD|nr:A/G-specific adenine glycosylase [Algiphilus aromaticivorans]